MGRIDRTFDPVSAYGSEQWCAAKLGYGYENWRKNIRTALEAEGFPRRDPLVGLTLKADVEAWLAKRRRVSDTVRAADTTSGVTKVNKHAL